MKKLLIALGIVALLASPVIAKEYGSVQYNTKCVNLGSTTSATYDLEVANCWIDTIDTGATTMTFANPYYSGLTNLTLILTNGGSQTITWPATVRWTGATEPVLTASGLDWIECATFNGGQLWYCFVAGLDLK